MKRKAIVRHDIRARSGFHYIEQRVDLDEVIIPGVLHAEHMGGGVWCVIFGDHDLHVSASKRRIVIVERSAKVRE